MIAPGGAETAPSYATSDSAVCTVDATSGALRLLAAGDCEVTATAASTANYNEAAVTFTVTVLPAGNLVLNVAAPIATDNIVNIAEKAAGFEIGGDTGTEADVDVTVTVGTTELSATSADVDGTAAWSVQVPANAAYIGRHERGGDRVGFQDRVHRPGRRGAHPEHRPDRAHGADLHGPRLIEGRRGHYGH